MQIQKYGLTLKRMDESDIEEVRVWRTSPEINQFMIRQEYITPEMQKKWFYSLDPRTQYYFVVQQHEKRHGVVNLSKVDIENKCAEAGIFILPNSWETDIPVRAVFALFDFAFEDLKMDYLYARVLESNKRALQFNLRLGYRITDRSSDHKVLNIRLDRNGYKVKTARLRVFLKKA